MRATTPVGKRLCNSKGFFPRKLAASTQKVLKREAFDPFADYKQSTVIGLEPKYFQEVRMMYRSEPFDLLPKKIEPRCFVSDGQWNRPERDDAI